MANYLDLPTQDQQANILASNVRSDILHAKAFISESNIRKVLLGLASEWLYLKEKSIEICDEYNPATTTAFIEEWEQTVGIPGECFDNTGTLEDRRNKVLLKLASTNATTARQFEAIGEILGFDISVEPAAESDAVLLPATLPIVLIAEADIPFTIIVNLTGVVQQVLPQQLPFTLTSDPSEILVCLFDKLKPAHTNVIFRYL
ncbi:unnamed protein product [marine sediment metagenome]|uniref:Phage tail protein n=1 Tax=marine sediment metagenome TaxID=412755 RepID=X0U043_9ZZZZ